VNQPKNRLNYAVLWQAWGGVGHTGRIDDDSGSAGDEDCN